MRTNFGDIVLQMFGLFLHFFSAIMVYVTVKVLYKHLFRSFVVSYFSNV